MSAPNRMNCWFGAVRCWLDFLECPPQSSRSTWSRDCDRGDPAYQWASLFDCIELCYKPKRRHPPLGETTPVASSSGVRRYCKVPGDPCVAQAVGPVGLE